MQAFLSGRTGFAALLAALWLLYAVVLLAPGHLAISGIEGDIVHALDGAARMVEGARPHLDFPTPLGAFAFGALALPLALGVGPGLAMLAANLGVALLLLPALFWLRLTRLGTLPAVLLALWVLIEATGLVYDGELQTTTFALYYNRWCWALFAVAALLLLFPEQGERRPAGDGLMLGLLLGALAMTKMTFFVALLLPALAWGLGGRRWRALGFALLGGAAVAGAVTLWAGDPRFWLAYLVDLAQVAGSDVRSAPGLSFAGVLAAPAYILGTFVLLAAIALLRMARFRETGLVLLLLMPGTLYATYQNWGNAPVWLVVVALVLIEAWRATPPERRAGPIALRPAFGALAVAAVTQAAPLVANMAISPFRHLGLGGSDYVPVMAVPGWDDLLFLASRATRVRAEVPLGTPPETTEPKARAEDFPTTFAGRSFPPCNTIAALVAQMTMRRDSLSALPQVASGAYLTADLINPGWMFTGGRPLPGGAPWYYGGAKGLDRADWLVVPQCPISPLARAQMLARLEAAGARFKERFADDVIVVYERAR